MLSSQKIVMVVNMSILEIFKIEIWGLITLYQKHFGMRYHRVDLKENRGIKAHEHTTLFWFITHACDHNEPSADC